MKRYSFIIQLALALVAVISILAIVQGILLGQRQTAIAFQATQICMAVELDPDLIQAGEIVYSQTCAPCHGVNLEGASNWETPNADGSYPPPPLNSSAHAWQHSDSSLIRTITNGRGSGKTTSMPAFGEQLGEDDIQAVIEFIKSTWETDNLNQQQLLNQPAN